MRTFICIAVLLSLLLLSNSQGVRALEEDEVRASLLLSALCMQHGRIREECRGVLPVSRLLEGEVPSPQSSQFRWEDSAADVMATPMDRPSKRGREKVSGFYSNW